MAISAKTQRGAYAPSELSPALKQKGQRIYLWFTGINALSYISLAESILILYALKLGGSDAYVAVLTSFLYLTMPFMLLGKSLVGKLGAARAQALSWFLRNLSAALMILAPVVARKFSVTAGLDLLLLAAFLFFTFRSMGIVSSTPIVGEITSEQDRGVFISKVFMTFNILSLLLMVVLTFLLDRYNSVTTFQFIILFGVTMGVISSYLILHVPESPQARISGREKLHSAYRFITGHPAAFRLLISWSAISMAIMFVVPISVVVVKKGYGLSDHIALLFIIVQFLGNIYGSYTNKLLLDHVGSRPLIILATFGLLFVQLMWVAAPAHASFAFLLLLFFILGATLSGTQTSLSHYFLSTIPISKRVGASMFINIAGGLVAGVTGSILAGGFLRFLHHVIQNQLLVYKIYFGVVALIEVFVIATAFRLKRQKERRVSDVLGMFFSFRDWRAIYTLQKLSRPTREQEDMSIVNKLQGIASDLGEDVLVNYLESPRFTIRGKALQALNQIEISPQTARRIVQELQQGEFTTAHLAAELLGDHGVTEAIPSLRKALESKDIFLQGKAMLALVRLRDEASYSAIISIFRQTNNPRILIYGARAIGLMGKRENIALLLEKIRLNSLPEHVRDEILYDACDMIGIGNEFYNFFNLFKRSPESGILALQDFIAQQLAGKPEVAQKILDVIEAIRDKGDSKNLLLQLFTLPAFENDLIISELDTFVKHCRTEKIDEKIIFSLLLISAKILAEKK